MNILFFRYLLPSGKVLIFLCALFVFNGCAFKHDTSLPLEPISASSVKLNHDIKLSKSEDAWPKDEWWKQDQDEQLNELVARALLKAPAMAIAKAKVNTAEEYVKAIDASTGLYAGLTGTVAKEKISKEGFLGPYGEHKPWYTTASLGIGAEYSLDIWGKDRARVDAAIGAERARQAEEEHVRLLVTSHVASIYYHMQTLFAMQAILEQIRDIKQEIVNIHDARAARGLEPYTIVNMTLSQKLAIDQQINKTSADIKILREALRALIGSESVDAMPSIIAHPLPQGANALPSTLNYRLLERRADLQAMHWYIEASMSHIEAAKAAFYPSFDIKAFFGFDAIRLEDLLKTSSHQFAIVPGLSLPLFDSGRLNANLALAHTQSNELIAQYNQAVLNTVQEVAKAAIDLESYCEQITVQNDILASTTFTYRSAQAHFERGLIDKLALIEAKLPLLQEENNMLRLRNQRLQNQVALIVALGGDYSH